MNLPTANHSTIASLIIKGAKKGFVFTLLIFALWTRSSGQSTSVPQMFNYTTQVTDGPGAPVINTPINIQATLRNGSPNGAVVYSEINGGTTSPAGIFTVVVGGGTIVAGNFNNVPWTSGRIYLQVGMDVTDGTNFVNMGAAQLVSQPYSLVSGNGISAVDFDSAGRTIVNTTNGWLMINSTKSAWVTGGNAGAGPNGYIGTSDTTDLVLKRNSIEGLRLGANKVEVAGNLGVSGVRNPLTALDVNGALALRDTGIYVYGNFTLNTSSKSSFMIYAGAQPSNSICSLTNGLTPGQLLIIMVSKNINSNYGISFVPGNNIRIAGGHGNGNSNITLTDAGVITFIWNGTSWLQSSISNNN